MPSENMGYGPRGSAKQPFGVLPIPDSPRIRNRKILRVLLWSLPFAVVVLFVGIWLATLSVWAIRAGGPEDEAGWEKALRSFSSQATLTSWFPSPWVAQYNLGTALAQTGDLEAAVNQFQIAYEGVPKAVPGEEGNIEPFSYECQVRINLSATLELLGDQAASMEEEEAALAHYEDALSWVRVCEVSAPPSDGGESEETEQMEEAREENPGGEASDRIERKMDDLSGDPDEQEDPKDPDDPDNGEEQEPQPQDPFEGETEEERQRREDLEGKNQDQSEREREREESQNRNPGTGGW